MRTYNDIKREHPKALIDRNVFAAYYTDGDKEEWIYFKMIPRHVVRYISKGLHQMRAFAHYRLEHNEEPFRYGYACEKYCLQMIERDEAHLSVPDVKRITSEMVEAMGYTLHWVPVNKLLNMKLRKI